MFNIAFLKVLLGSLGSSLGPPSSGTGLEHQAKEGTSGTGAWTSSSSTPSSSRVTSHHISQGVETVLQRTLILTTCICSLVLSITSQNL